MNKLKIREIFECRICNEKKLNEIINLGSQPISNQFISEDNIKNIIFEKAPLVLIKCFNCGLVQLKHTVDKDQIYKEYWYRSGINQTMRDALKDITIAAQKNINLDRDDIIIDIGCNDGTLLNFFDSKKYKLIGFDPALNIFQKNENFLRIKNYFSFDAFNNLKLKNKAKLITSIAMFYDLDNPNEFVKDISLSLKDDGLWIIQIADLHTMIKGIMYDQIIHEHLEFYHLKPLEYLFEKHNLKICKIEKNTINGSSYRIFVKKNINSYVPDKSVDYFKEFENKANLENTITYLKFSQSVKDSKKKIKNIVEKINNENKVVFGLGASTKGNVILNYCSFSELEIPYIVDRNPLKKNCRAIGSNIPILTENEAKKNKPDYYLLLPYFFQKEIISREKNFLIKGGKIIIPLPTVKILDYDNLFKI